MWWWLSSLLGSFGGGGAGPHYSPQPCNHLINNVHNTVPTPKLFLTSTTSVYTSQVPTLNLNFNQTSLQNTMSEGPVVSHGRGGTSLIHSLVRAAESLLAQIQTSPGFSPSGTTMLTLPNGQARAISAAHRKSTSTARSTVRVTPMRLEMPTRLG